jgi:hypothetical protein
LHAPVDELLFRLQVSLVVHLQRLGGPAHQTGVHPRRHLTAPCEAVGAIGGRFYFGEAGHYAEAIANV